MTLVLLLEVNRKLSFYRHWHARGAVRLRLRIFFLDQVLNTRPAGLSSSLQHYLLRRVHFVGFLFVDFVSNRRGLHHRRQSVDKVWHSLAAFFSSWPKGSYLCLYLYNWILASSLSLIAFLSALHALNRRHLLAKLNGMDDHVQVVLGVLLKVSTNELLSSNLPHLIVRHINALEVGDQLRLLHIL